MLNSLSRSYGKVVNWLRKHYLLTKLILSILILFFLVLLIFDVVYSIFKPLMQQFSKSSILFSTPLQAVLVFFIILVLFLVLGTYSKLLEEDKFPSSDKSMSAYVNISPIIISSLQRSGFTFLIIPIAINGDHDDARMYLLLEKAQRPDLGTYQYKVQIKIKKIIYANNHRNINFLLYFIANGTIETSREITPNTQLHIFTQHPYIIVGPEYSDYLETRDLLILSFKGENYSIKSELNAYVLVKWNTQEFGNTIDMDIGTSN